MPNLPPELRRFGPRLPAEGCEHAETWSAWPTGDALWEGVLEAVRDEMAAFLAAVARFERLCLLVPDAEAERDARARLEAAGAPGERVAYLHVPLDDAWLRDSGPLFVRGRGGRVAATDWRFDAWGGKYAWQRDDRVPAAVADALGMRRFALPWVLEGGAVELGPDGTVLTTRSCLLDAARNPGWSLRDYDALLEGALGAARVIWLAGGLVDDHTDGHVDTVARFADAGTVLYARADADDHANRPTLEANLEVLRAARRPDGAPYRLLPLPLPTDRSRFGDRRPPRTYANFYVGNGFVIAPTYDDPRDAEALDVLRSAFPAREVLGLPASALVTGGGAFHCMTQQRPAGEVAHDA